MSLQMRFHVPRGLTPAAPGCTTFVRRIKRHWQCTYARRPRAASVSPQWLAKRACRAIRFVFGERTHLDKSGGRQPAVGLQTASATALRWISALQVCISRTFHGGLTPPALVWRGVCLRTNAHVVADAFPCPTGGLRPPLLIRMCGGVCTKTLVFRWFVYSPRGANAPRSWLHDVCSLHKATLAVHIRTPIKSGGR
jgi:hypothetical protein